MKLCVRTESLNKAIYFCLVFFQSVTFSQDQVSVSNGQNNLNGLSGLSAQSSGASKNISESVKFNTPTNSSRQIGIGLQPNSNGNVNSPSAAFQELQNSPVAQTATVNNQFQRFVTDTTGRTLDLFGYNLFNSNSYYPNNIIPAPSSYLIGPGDEIDIKVWGSVDFNVRQIVDRDGRITLPQIGSIGIAGTKVENLDDKLKKQISRIYKTFEVAATLSRLRNIQIYVVGYARKPGAYSVSALSSLVSALFEVGGPSQLGTMRNIRLIREGKEISQIDLYDFIQNGGELGNLQLLAGDVIQIPAAGPRVALIGAIDGQAIYELKNKNSDLESIIKFIGETNSLVSPTKVLIERINSRNPLGNRSVEEVSLNEDGLATKIKDGDVISLFKINSKYTNAITLKGNVAAPLRYKYKEGMRVSDLIPEPEALITADYYSKRNIEVMHEVESHSKTLPEAKSGLNEINWDYALVERLDKKEIKVNYIDFNLRKAITEKNPTHDIQLIPGDVVVVFSNKEIQLPQKNRNIYVKVSGEVNAPGIYQIGPSEDLVSVVKRAGGLTKEAYLYGAVFTRESVRRLQQENLNKAINRIESDINSQSATLLQNSAGPEMTASIQIQMASQKSFLYKIKNLKSTGRISLELDPKALDLPSVALEDGDEIYVPNRPSSIAIAGAVYSELTFIYKPGLKVRDYLNKSGLSREADDKSTLIIRADGSIDSDAKGMGFFDSKVLDMSLYPGDYIFVPEVLDRRTPYTQFISGAKDWTTILYQFGIGAAAWKTLRN